MNTQKVHLLDQSGKAYTNLEESMRPYLKSLTPEQFEEDKNWWCTALEITGNQQSTFTIGQIVGNVISQVWDQIPALSRIKEWHKQAVDPSAACMEEANQVAKYFMMIHPRQTFQYIDNNGGKKGKSARYKMAGAITEITLGSDIDWDKQTSIAWRFGKTGLCGACKNYKQFYRQIIVDLLNKIDPNVLIDYCTNLDTEWDDPGEMVAYDMLKHERLESFDHSIIICSNNDIADDLSSRDMLDNTNPCIELQDWDEEEITPGVYLYLNRYILNNGVIDVIKFFFDIYGLSYDDLKIQFI